MKKMLSCVLAGLLALQGTHHIVLAANSGHIQVGSASVKAGETFELPVILEKNPGVVALSLNLNYDADDLELIGVEDGKLLGTSTFFSGNILTKIPYTMNWDDISTDNNTGTGTLATLSFRAKEDASGETEISVSVNQKSTFNFDFEEVLFTTENGTIQIDDSEPITTTTGQAVTTSITETTPAMPEEAAILVDTVTASKGSNIVVPIRIQNNPGLAALSLNISYDNTMLKLLGAEDGKLLGTSTFLASENMTRIPYILNWDTDSAEDNSEDGIVANLEFEVLAETGDAKITIAVNRKSTFNVNLEEVAISVVNGAVKIEIPQTTTVTTSTTAKPTTTVTTSTTAKPTTTVTTSTTAKPTTTVTTSTTAKPTTTVTTSTTAKPTTTVTTSTTAKPTTTVTTSTTAKTTTTVTTSTTAKPTTTTAKATTNAAPVTTTSATETTPIITTSAATAPLRGDVTGDGEVSVDDAQLTLKAYTERIAGNDMKLTAEQIKAADVNGDGEVSVDDAQNILIYYVNNTVAGKILTWDELLGKKTQTAPRPKNIWARLLKLSA